MSSAEEEVAIGSMKDALLDSDMVSGGRSQGRSGGEKERGVGLSVAHGERSKRNEYAGEFDDLMMPMD